tara:strand:+ start:44808 stop:47903 length:3096 start_codon:yes stop_codon:yes gene_type:complete
LAADRIDLAHEIEHAAHLLPSQGPITVFVHHNTLHAFEDMSFDSGVKAGGSLYGCHAYLPESRYRQKLESGRIRVEDLSAVFIDDLGDEADRLVGNFGTRYALRLAMLQFPLRTGSGAQLRWVIAETDALRVFREEVPHHVRDDMIAATRQWVMQETANGNRVESPSTPDAATDDPFTETLASLSTKPSESWNNKNWEAFTLSFLWRVCQRGVRLIHPQHHQEDTSSNRVVRDRDLLLKATGLDTDQLVNDILIRFCASFLDQGFAQWEIPNHEAGLYQSFLRLYGKSFAAPTRWFSRVRRELRRLIDSNIDPEQSINESLAWLGITDEDREEFLTQTLLALRGWAGMVWQMETNAEWAPHPAPPNSLLEYVAVRLILDRLAIEQVGKDTWALDGPIEEIRQRASRCVPKSEPNGSDSRAFVIFQLAQARGWNPHDLRSLSPEQWTILASEIDSFSEIERRRTYHLAFEHKYRNETLDAVVAHSKRVQTNPEPPRPSYQIVCCIDEREESFRRHLEELVPDCETLGVAGFFGVAMYYRGAADAHFTPLCPVNIKPQHYVVEEPMYSVAESERRRAETRRRIGHATHRAHHGTRTVLGGVLTGLAGSIAAFPLVARILFPRTTSRIRRRFAGIVHTPGTELRIERLEKEPGPDNGHLGYSVQEMADIVEGGLRAIGITQTKSFSPLLIICGHGSASMNNPHEAAHDCGACGGGRGGPNARAFAQMANDGRVRRLLQDRGLVIPEGTYVVGGYHNTCDDSMTWYDLDRVPVPHRRLFEKARMEIDEARKRSAHERCRRFESAELSLSPDEALRHVEGRAEDLSQTRPEYGHATNALCFVGRRSWSRGLYLDRRAFLTSYDPTEDDEQHSILERLLQAVIPVCAGINLEYYFSYVDPTGYGCGTKLPHNITSLLGVMDGAASDLRPGLPWQMVEIHEPVRLLFVIESTPDAMQRIIAANEAISKLVNGDWVQLAVFDATTSNVHRYVDGRFVRYIPQNDDLPTRTTSTEWYSGHREHLGFASITVASTQEGAPS